MKRIRAIELTGKRHDPMQALVAGLVAHLLSCTAPCESTPNLVAQYDVDVELEPSGIVWHPLRETLVVVGDSGDIVEFERNGTWLREGFVTDDDIEAVTVSPESGLLYMAIEGDDDIIEVDATSFAVLRRFNLPREIDDQTVLQEGGDGLEGLTFLPDAEHAEGGTFLIANQASETATGDRAGLLEVTLPLLSGGVDGTNLSLFGSPMSDLSGLAWDGQLLAISDRLNQLYEMDLAGNVTGSCRIPGKDQEGLAVDGDQLWVVDEAGLLLAFDRL